MSSDSNSEVLLCAAAPGTEQNVSATNTQGIFTEEQLQSMRDLANSQKDIGNSLFSRQLFDEAIAHYSLALDSAPPQDPCRSVFFNNRAACFQSKGDLDKCICDCTDSLKIDPNYLKPLLRRACTYEQRGDVIEAFTDFEDALKKHPTNPQAAAGVSRLSAPASAAREKQKAEMLGKLKEVGNSFLGLFGLSDIILTAACDAILNSSDSTALIILKLYKIPLQVVIALVFNKNHSISFRSKQQYLLNASYHIAKKNSETTPLVVVCFQVNCSQRNLFSFLFRLACKFLRIFRSSSGVFSVLCNPACICTHCGANLKPVGWSQFGPLLLGK